MLNAGSFDTAASVAVRAAALPQSAIHGETSAADTAVVHSPLPAGVGPLMRTMFNLPPWVQIAGAVIGVIVALIVLWFLWTRREAILTWLTTRSRGWKIAMVGAGAVVVFIAGGVGFAGFHYMEHDNGFCVSCHVMTTAFSRFQQSEHRKLECHQCHRQNMLANARQLYYWVAERPDKIPPHAKVPTKICSECHMQQEAGDSTWKRVLSTGGHAIHMRNGDPKLKGIECVTCHGAEVHRFTTVAKTCGQANCHDDVKIRLGKMAAQTSLHCTQCHDFGRKAIEGISPDSARIATIPVSENCLSCHQMREKLATFDPAREPHKAVCGTCHDPHKQTDPKESWKTCTNGGCHSKPDTLTPFHRGIAATTLAQCGTCHKAHTWRVQGGQCQACHKGAFGRHPVESAEADARGKARPDSAAGKAAAKAAAPTTGPVSALPDDWLGAAGRRPHGPMPDLSDPPAQGTPPAPAVPLQDTTPRAKPTRTAARPEPFVPRGRFPHDRHTSLACHACHSPGEAHGKVTVRAPQDCQACHHSTQQRAVCTTCHTTTETAAPRVATVDARGSVWTGVRTRSLTFEHARHANLQCRSCHGSGTNLGSPKSCTSCHDDHHDASRNCVSCHSAGAAGHPREAVHQGCTAGGCHQDARIAALEPSRNVCLVCHRQQTDHKPGRDCASCHLVSWRGVTASAGAGR